MPRVYVATVDITVHAHGFGEWGEQRTLPPGTEVIVADDNQQPGDVVEFRVGDALFGLDAVTFERGFRTK